MKGEKGDAVLRQWHPAFFAGIQIELKEEAENLIFENEHQLGTKPMGIDDFYKVYGYGCFYKADVKKTDSIKIEELTISFVCYRYPYKLMKHLKTERQYTLEKAEDGIYHILGDKIPIQIIITKALSEAQNLWLRSLTEQLENIKNAERLIGEYKKNKEDPLYKSVMDLIVRANREKFLEVKVMCQALEELMKDELEAKKNEGKEIGKEIGEKRVNSLTIKLCEMGRTEDILKAAENTEYQKKLFVEFGL